MENIFENAYFGKAYETRDGRKAILIQPKNYHVILEDLSEYSVMSDGLAYDDMATSYDIVSEWQEEINEEDLDKLADEYCETKCFEDEFEYTIIKNAFKAGLSQRKK